MKIYIITDLEGVAGVTAWDSHTGQARDREALAWMTLEIQAAIEGARAAGAKQIVVNESHTVQLDLLDKDVRYVLSSRFNPNYLAGLDRSFNAVLMIGKHARAGAAGGVLNHTGNSAVRRQTLNGVEMGETGFEMAYAGALGVPVVFLSGDEEAVKEARELVPSIVGVPVKKGYGKYKALSLHPRKAQELIRAGVQRALTDRKDTPPYRLKPPYTLEMEFTNTQYAANMSLIPGVRRIEAHTIRYNSRRFPDLVKIMLLKGFLYTRE